MERYRKMIIGISMTATVLAVLTIIIVVVRTLNGYSFDDLGITMGVSIICIILAISNIISAKKLSERNSEK